MAYIPKTGIYSEKMTTLPANPVLVELWRGPQVECVYRGAAAIVDADGEVKFSMGDIHAPTFPRSSVKSVQALPLVESGAADAFGFSEAELALTCASHSGEPLHVDLARSMLTKIGLETDALQCGTHWPLGRYAERALVREGGKPSVFHHNCSGKHIGMLAACQHQGLPLANYTQIDHPLQKTIAETLSDLSGDDVKHDNYGVDGCSVPNWPMSLRGMGRVFARITTGSGLDQRRAEGFLRLVKAGFAAPLAMGGTKRFPTEILQNHPGKIYIKEGAEGVCCGAIIDKGLGIAVKIDDGSRKPSEIVLANLLLSLIKTPINDNDPLVKKKSAILHSCSGENIGEIIASKPLKEALNYL